MQGALNISDAMEALSSSLTMNRVPAGWAKVAYASLKPLGDWFADMLRRVAQLVEWSDNMKTPKSLWISGLFNPMAFVTAVMQVTRCTDAQTNAHKDTRKPCHAIHTGHIACAHNCTRQHYNKD